MEQPDMPPATNKVKVGSQVDNPAPPIVPDLAAHSLIIHDILRYLDDTSLARCLRVNKYFSSLVGPILYRDVVLDTLDGVDRLIQFMEGCPHETKRIQIKPNMKWKPLLLTHVKHLTLRGQHWDELHDEPAMILKLPNLQTLRIQKDLVTDPKKQILYPCDLLLGLQPKTLIFNCSLRTFYEVGLCWHQNNLKKLECMILIIHYSQWDHDIKPEDILKPLDGRMKLPVKVDIVFRSSGPIGGNSQRFLITHWNRPVLTQRLARLPWFNAKTHFRLVNTKAVLNQRKNFYEEVDWNVPGQYGQEVIAAIEQEIPKGKQGKLQLSAIQEAKSRMELMDMEDYLREVDWKLMMDRIQVRGWLAKLGL